VYACVPAPAKELPQCVLLHSGCEACHIQLVLLHLTGTRCSSRHGSSSSSSSRRSSSSSRRSIQEESVSVGLIPTSRRPAKPPLDRQLLLGCLHSPTSDRLSVARMRICSVEGRQFPLLTSAPPCCMPAPKNQAHHSPWWCSSLFVSIQYCILDHYRIVERQFPTIVTP
jgi:hypothetical protein